MNKAIFPWLQSPCSKSLYPNILHIRAPAATPTLNFCPWRWDLKDLVLAAHWLGGELALRGCRLYIYIFSKRCHCSCFSYPIYFSASAHMHMQDKALSRLEKDPRISELLIALAPLLMAFFPVPSFSPSPKILSILLYSLELPHLYHIHFNRR